MHLVTLSKKGKWSTIRITDITKVLWEVIYIAVTQVGFKPTKVSVHSIKVGGAMELTLTRCENSTIRLMGRWRSSIMPLYIYTSEHTFTADMEIQTVQHGDYELIPTAHEG